MVDFSDDALSALLDDYLEPPTDPNPRMSGVSLVWDDAIVAKLKERHGVETAEVEEVLFQIPPEVEVSRTKAGRIGRSNDL